MKLGAFSISLAVKDLQASRAFYEALGFSIFAGSAEQNYFIMKNESSLIGLFQGMFDKNMLTFNPGWDQQCNETESFTDVREIQKSLKAAEIPLLDETDEAGEGPGSLMIADPDGNPILIDQHR